MDRNQFGAGLLRITLGAVLVAHGLLKVLVFTLPGTVAFFASLGLPAIIAYLTVIGELILGSALVVGFKTRWSALASMPILIGALWAHSGNGWLFSNPNGGWEFPALLVILAGIVAIQGPSQLLQKEEKHD